MSRKVRLHATQGASEANYSGSPVPFPVDIHGDVEVDEEAVGPLLEKGGFILADPIPPVSVPDGMVKMFNPDDPSASCGYRGVSYTPDSDGFVMVPCEAASELIGHGFMSAETFAASLAEPDAPIPADAAAAEPTPTPEPKKEAPAKAPSAEPLAKA